MISFAQNFEDVMLERLFAGKKRGFYVDVGAWDPEAYSVTRHFYLRGWRGLNIEPIAARHAMFVKDRPRDVNFHGLVGSGSGATRFYECVEQDYLSTTVPDVADALRAKGLTVNEYDVNVERLDVLIQRYCPKVIDFLKLDVEGSEADVLKTIDLERFRPRALVIEATVPGSGLKSWDEPDAFAKWGEWEDDVLRQGYLFARFDGLNRFYVRQEDKRLAHRLTLPPGIFDGIDPSQLPQAAAEARLEVIERQKVEIGVLRGRAEAAESWVAHHEQHRLAAQAQIESLTADLQANLAAVETERAAKANLVTAMHQQLQEVHVVIGKFDQGLRSVIAENGGRPEGAVAESDASLLNPDAAPVNQSGESLNADRASELEALRAEIERLETDLAFHKAEMAKAAQEREELACGLTELQSIADQRQKDLYAINTHVEVLDRQLTDARQAIQVFEQWFSRLNTPQIDD